MTKRLAVKKGARTQRGSMLLQTVIAMGIMTAILGLALGVYVRSTRSFYEENSAAYLQGRTRASLDRLAEDCRAAQGVLATVAVGVHTYRTSDGTTGPACIILQVPAQDALGPFFYSSKSSTPNAAATDVVIYSYNPNDQTLRRTTVPVTNVQTDDPNNPVRSSYRQAETEAIVAHDVAGLGLVFRDGSGAGTSAYTTAALLDVAVNMVQNGQITERSSLTVSGVRLRNAHCGSISGVLFPAVSGATVQAVVASGDGAFPSGTILGTATSDNNGAFLLTGLRNGSYQLKITSPTGTVTNFPKMYTVSDEQNTVAGQVPAAL